MYLSSMKPIWISLITSPIIGMILLANTFETILYKQPIAFIGLKSLIQLGFQTLETKVT